MESHLRLPTIIAMLTIQTALLAIVNIFLRTRLALLTRLHLAIWPSCSWDEKKYEADDEKLRVLLPRESLSHGQAFLERVEMTLRTPLSTSSLLMLSHRLKAQYLERIQDPICMLPSFNHQLPTGDERGRFLALDLGGSTLRVALVELTGSSLEVHDKCQILSQKSFPITSPVKALRGMPFFHWLAKRIEETLMGQDLPEPSFPMGVSWSFPIEQTSHQSGRLLQMGKGFLAAEGLLRQDLGQLIESCCHQRGLNVRLHAIINDSSATLLSTAYLAPATRFALILGTGVNAAVHLPVGLFGAAKFGIRPSEWFASAQHVIVNTEMSMMGHDILPTSKWDESLRAHHPNPDFQPLETLVSGGHLGEIIRLILVDAIESAGFFGGIVPPSLREKYSLSTETISQVEQNHSTHLSTARHLFSERHPTTNPPSDRDLEALHLIASHVIYRASCLVAAGIHALWHFRNEVEGISPSQFSHTIVAYNGSVIENYPGFRAACQVHLDLLVQASGGNAGMVELAYARESSLIGAAIACAVST